MTNPYLTPERLALQARARKVAMTEVLPVADELDRQGADIPDALIERLAVEGYFGIRVPAEYGGLGLGVFEYVLVTEELSRAWMSVPSLLARGNGFGCDVPDPEHRAELLRRSARGEWIGAFSASEPGAGSDLAGISCRAHRLGSNWVLTGEKRWTGNAIRADFIVMIAREHDPAPGEHRTTGLVALLIEKKPGTLPKGMVATPIDKIGYHGITTYNLHLDGVLVPASAALEGNAFAGVVHGLNVARVHTAARAIGLARGALEDSQAYLLERHQFERPLASFQALRFTLADMAADIEAARALTYQAAHALDAGDQSATLPSMCKLVATEMAVRVTNQAMQLHGGNGYTTERRVERYWRDARLTTIFEGTSEIQRTLIADNLLGHKR
ncbi:acyl-CoA dehydrogenase family protein [Nocardia pseudovaccinii]|uniref:acyl-CoA dehydrogenase family protein n=1 Tax=Nocardia pseudovaccinii TaxID=189540 RepID=UPI0007A46F44|nr:acyl-CoA dehydrogenase family protein [Nocardia pseudovaccinii]